MMKNSYFVKNPFRATMIGNEDHSRTFKLGETVWCDIDQLSDPITFEVDLVQFKVPRIEFAKALWLGRLCSRRTWEKHSGTASVRIASG
jgi:hypothetical protein